MKPYHVDCYVTVEYFVHIRNYPKPTPGVHTFFFPTWEDACEFERAILYMYVRHQQARILAIGHRAPVIQTELDL